MDWSVLKHNAPNPWLRKELVYSSYIPVSGAASSLVFSQLTECILQLYYFAIVSSNGMHPYRDWC
jgi:hypothetical protein